MSKRKKLAEVDEPVEDYPHGSMYHGDTPPPWLAASIERRLKDNPYRDMPQDELKALARTLYQASKQLDLVQAVLMARNSVW